MKLILKLVTIACISFILESVYASDFLIQKVGLSTELSGPDSNLNILVEQAVLAAALDETNVQIFSSRKNDLKLQGVQQLNASLKLVCGKPLKTKGGMVPIELYASGSNASPLDNSVMIDTSKLSDTLVKAARQVVSVISSRYPPRKKEELVVIESQKITVSEFEPQKPVWSITFAPALNAWDIQYSVRLPIGNEHITLEPQLSTLYMMGKLDWRYLFLSAGFGFGGTYDQSGLNPLYSMNASFDFGLGWFGSLLITGLSLRYVNSHAYLARSQTISNITAYMPEYYSTSLFVGPLFRFNITRSYYFELKSGTMVYNSLRLLFDNGSGTLQEQQKKASGGVLIGFLFHIGVWDRLKMEVGWDYQVAEIRGDSQYENFRFEVISGSGLILDTFREIQNLLWLGVSYDF